MTFPNQPSRPCRVTQSGAFAAACAGGGCTVVGQHLWVTVWGSQADSCHLGGAGLFTPFLPSLFNKQDDTVSRRAPEILFACILCLTYSQEEPSQGWPVLGGFPAISVPKRGFEWKSSQISGCS